MSDRPNETLVKFGYPGTALAEYESWVVLARPKQVTLGSLVLVCREDATSFSAISAAAFAGLEEVVSDVEANLLREVAYEKINYLMLMMVDPNVHFHVFPRYEGSRAMHGIVYSDTSWPGPPDLKATVALAEADLEQLTAHLRGAWQRRRR